MSVIKFNCPSCNERVEAGAEDADQAAECPKCGGEMRVPRTSQLRLGKPGNGHAAASPAQTDRLLAQLLDEARKQSRYLRAVYVLIIVFVFVLIAAFCLGVASGIMG